jgi:hypothetical protein
MTEPDWLPSRREFLKSLPDTEKNIILAGDPEQKIDPYSYNWIYTYPELAIQVPEIQNNFQHLLQFEGNQNLIYHSTNQLSENKEQTYW